MALVVPLQGPAGIFGPSTEACATLAVEEVNRAGGILAREVVLHVVDGGRPPATVARELDALVTRGLVQAVVGWHVSPRALAAAPRLAGRVPYLYPALHEGGMVAPGVFLTGADAGRLLVPPLRWLARDRGARRWFVVGNDFLWPRLLADRVRGHARERHLRVVGQAFVGMGTGEFGPVLDQVAASGADGVAVLLLGDDAVSFNRAFADRGLDEAVVRFSPLVEENLLAAIGAGGTRGLSSAAGYFESLVTPEALAFGGRYAGRFGPEAPPLNALGEAHYEAVHLLACLAHTAGTIDVGALSAVPDTAVYEGPRGALKMRSAHLDQRVYLADAAGMEFDVVVEP